MILCRMRLLNTHRCQDKDALVRRHALLLLTQLLLQDFLKWRGMLLFRFIAASVDSDPVIY